MESPPFRQRLAHAITIQLICLQLLTHVTEAFYVPGVAPQDFAKGGKIDVRAIKMTSSHTQLPYEYYSLPICKPADDEIEYKAQVIQYDDYSFLAGLQNPTHQSKTF